jgi:hypothetical protein
MDRGWGGAVLVIGIVLAMAGTSAAQQRQAEPTLEADPDLDAADQLAPSQIKQPMPAAVAEPSGAGRTRAATRGLDAMIELGAAAKLSPAPKQYVVACSGVFGRDSSHVKLAMVFQAHNVAFTQVDGGSAGKVMASVLFAKEPKHRLEVWWSNAARRTATHLIVINGQSDWSAPGELRLGLTLPELERLNGKPFTVSGFDGNNVSTLSDWNGGGLAVLPGGCKVGMSLRAAPVAGLSAFPANREFSSSDGTLRQINPKVSEILVAY